MSLTLLEELDLGGMKRLTSREHLMSLSQLRKLNLGDCIYLTPSKLSRLLDLDLTLCVRLPISALSPLSAWTALKQLDIRGCKALDLTPLTSCHDLRRLYVCLTPGELNVDVAPLEGLMPRLVVEDGVCRQAYLDARSL